MDPDFFEASIWRPIVERAGLKGTRFHDLRHFFASQLIANCETATYVRDQMDHSSIHTTFDTYGHLFPGCGKEAGARYERSMETEPQLTVLQRVAREIRIGMSSRLPAELRKSLAIC